MKINQLRYFVATAEQGSLSRASRVVHVAQPALTQQIKNLEHSLGATLFDRTASGVTLTAAGTVLLSHARHIIDSLERARQDVMLTGSELRGEVSIAVPRMISSMISPGLLRRLNDLYPNISLRILEGNTLYCSEMVENARVDVGISAAGSKNANTDSQTLFRQEIYLVGAISNKFGISASFEPITFTEALSYPLSMIRKPHSLRIELEELAHDRGRALNIVHESASGAVSRHMVVGGLAFSFLPRMSFLEKQDSGLVFARRVIQPDLSRDYVIQWPRARKMNDATHAVANLIRDEHAQMLPSGVDFHPELSRVTNSPSTNLIS